MWKTFTSALTKSWSAHETADSQDDEKTKQDKKKTNHNRFIDGQDISSAVDVICPWRRRRARAKPGDMRCRSVTRVHVLASVSSTGD